MCKQSVDLNREENCLTVKVKVSNSSWKQEVAIGIHGNYSTLVSSKHFLSTGPKTTLQSLRKKEKSRRTLIKVLKGTLGVKTSEEINEEQDFCESRVCVESLYLFFASFLCCSSSTLDCMCSLVFFGNPCVSLLFGGQRDFLSVSLRISETVTGLFWLEVSETTIVSCVVEERDQILVYFIVFTSIRNDSTSARNDKLFSQVAFNSTKMHPFVKRYFWSSKVAFLFPCNFLSRTGLLSSMYTRRYITTATTTTSLNPQNKSSIEGKPISDYLTFVTTRLVLHLRLVCVLQLKVSREK